MSLFDVSLTHLLNLNNKMDYIGVDSIICYVPAIALWLVSLKERLVAKKAKLVYAKWGQGVVCIYKHIFYKNSILDASLLAV